ncbi:hypothetical protein Ae201684P_016738 [Aphanomyces euteiches]|nr:hypothetical protein Ae201684P_016738 [Aphanomyces euteiches]
MRQQKQAIVPLVKSKTIKLKLKCTDDEDLEFKVKRTAYLQKIFDNFAKIKGVPVETFRFFYDGVRLKGNVTVDGIGIEDGSSIDCFTEQVGGTLYRPRTASDTPTYPLEYHSCKIIIAIQCQFTSKLLNRSCQSIFRDPEVCWLAK